jgi:hypothetical protein
LFDLSLIDIFHCCCPLLFNIIRFCPRSLLRPPSILYKDNLSRLIRQYHSDYGRRRCNLGRRNRVLRLPFWRRSSQILYVSICIFGSTFGDSVLILGGCEGFYCCLICHCCSIHHCSLFIQLSSHSQILTQWSHTI